MITSAGILVSSTSPSQIFTSTGDQLLIENNSSATSNTTQTIVRTICMGPPLRLFEPGLRRLRREGKRCAGLPEYGENP